MNPRVLVVIMTQIILEQFIACDRCRHNEAEIYQDAGNYCAECWQVVTYPDI
jgi:hypothetical protein